MSITSTHSYTQFCSSYILLLKQNMTKLGREGFIWITGHSPLSRKAKSETQGRNYLLVFHLTPSKAHARLVFFWSPGSTAQGGHYPQWLSHPTSISNQENASQTCPCVKTIQKILPLRFLFPKCVKLTTKLTRMDTHREKRKKKEKRKEETETQRIP